jgi:hypothetical protein
MKEELLALAFVMLFVFVCAIIGGLLYLTLSGLYLAFTSHVVTGIIALIVEPLPLIIGISNLFGHNIAPDITSFILGL